MVGGFAVGPRPWVTCPDTVIRRDGGCAPGNSEMRTGFKSGIEGSMPGIGWQSKDCTSCFVAGILTTSSCSPSVPWKGFPFHVKEELGR